MDYKSPMNYEQLAKATENPHFNDFDSETERCLWLAKVVGWEPAHAFVESLPEPGASWIHAMLHRAEKDLGNAFYWYSRAGVQPPSENISIEEEWHQIAKALLS